MLIYIPCTKWLGVYCVSQSKKSQGAKNSLALTGSHRPHGLISSSSRSAMWLMSVAIHPIRQITPAAISPTIRAVTNTVFIIAGLLSYSPIIIGMMSMVISSSLLMGFRGLMVTARDGSAN